MQHNVTGCVISTPNKFLNLVKRARIKIVIKKFYCHVNRFSLQCSRLNDGQNEKKMYATFHVQRLYSKCLYVFILCGRNTALGRFWESCVGNQNNCCMVFRRMTCDGNNITAHLINKNLVRNIFLNVLIAKLEIFRTLIWGKVSLFNYLLNCLFSLFI